MKLPDEIKRNPEIDVPVEGIRGWKVGGPDGLVIFFEIQPGTILPEHSHCQNLSPHLSSMSSRTSRYAAPAPGR